MKTYPLEVWETIYIKYSIELFWNKVTVHQPMLILILLRQKNCPQIFWIDFSLRKNNFLCIVSSVTFIFFDPKKFRNFWKFLGGPGLGPTGDLSNVTCRPRDTADMSKRSKRGQKSKLSKSRFIFQRLARTEATAKILGPWDQKWVQESPK